ncbi:MAG: carboxypeptidase-like regulatory domain-containing protein [bacterium]|nr:carboxypeptidase-like regulatory domain-containing protein [bacterium]
MMVMGCGRKPVPPVQPPPSIAAPQAVQDTAPDTPAPVPVPDMPTNMRPVQVTVYEYATPAAAAQILIENANPSSVWWSAHCDANGRATLLVPLQYTAFRVSAIKRPYAIVATNLSNLPKTAAPLQLALTLSSTGVVITAQITAARPALLSNLTVRIKPDNNADMDHVSAARVADATGPIIILPPILRGLTGLRLEVTSPRCARSFSAPFDTRDGQDKVVPVTLLEGVLVHGRALRDDGTPAGTFQLSGEPGEMYDLPRGAGTVNETVTTAGDGAYVCATFLPNFYRIQASCDKARPIRTNLLVDAEGSILDLTFRAPRFRTVNGKVLIERTKEPVANAMVTWNEDALCATTDVAGVFALRAPDGEQFFGRLSVAHENYAGVQRYVNNDYRGQMLTLLLREAAQIAGTVRYEDGTPVSGLYVNVQAAQQPNRQRASVAFGSENEYWEEQMICQYASMPSDAQGAYVVSNVAAPQTYRVDVHGQRCRLLRPEPNAAAISTRVGVVSQCDLTVRGTPTVLVKLLDQQRVPVREYELLMEYRFGDERGQQGGSRTQVEADADGWYCLSEWSVRHEAAFLTMQATTKEGLTAETNDLRVANTGTNFIVLTGSGTNEQGMCGYLYDSNDEPQVDAQMYAYQDATRRSLGNVRTDHLGFFEFAHGGDATGGTIRLGAYFNDTGYSTNVAASTAPIIWRLPPLRAVRGRVCLERADAPATNFAIGFDLYNKRSFSADDGRFSMPVEDRGATAGVVYAFIGDYAPAQTSFCLDAQGQCDVGDLIVSATAGTLRGRVVNERTQPLSAQATLVRAGARQEQVSAQTDAQDGRYEFTRLPTGAYQVAAYKNGQSGSARSAWIALNAQDVVDVPDLVLQMTNAALVRLTFVMADGTPAAGMQVSQLNNAMTDAQGMVEDYWRLGSYDNVFLYIDNARYFAESFVIEAGTRELRVTLLALELIAGTVTLDGQPLANDYIYLRDENSRYFSCSVHNGAFSVKAMPGAYVAVCSDKKVVCPVTLVAGDQNTIAFVSGTASLTITFPFTTTWNASFELDLAGTPVNIGHIAKEDTQTLEANNLPDGAYKVNFYGRMGDSYTNMQRTVILAPNAHETIAF